MNSRSTSRISCAADDAGAWFDAMKVAISLPVLALAWCGGAAAAGMSRVELPGFSLELPAGEVLKSTALPSDGSHRLVPAVKGVANAMVSVAWSQHGKSHDEFLVMHRDKTLRAVLGNSEAINNELTISPGRWIGFAGDPSTGEGAGLGVVTCEHGFSILFVVNTSNELSKEMKVARDIAKSVRCALTAANRQTVQATVRLSSRFGRLPTADAQQYYSRDDELIMVNPVAGNSFARGIPAVLDMMLGIMSGSVKSVGGNIEYVLVHQVETPGAQRLLVRFNGHPDIERRYIGVMYCGNIEATINSAILMPAIDDAKARELFAAFDCPGGQSTELDDIHDVLLDACAEGKEIACGYRARM
jgi:hypothetical protein